MIEVEIPVLFEFSGYTTIQQLFLLFRSGTGEKLLAVAGSQVEKAQR
jgi:hypothetical protein